MSRSSREFLRAVMRQAWTIYRLRHVPGCNVRTFGNALRNAWAWLHREALPPVAAGPVLHLRSMLQSPIRRSLAGHTYANRRAWEAGRMISRLGA